MQIFHTVYKIYMENILQEYKVSSVFLAICQLLIVLFVNQIDQTTDVTSNDFLILFRMKRH